jgi:LmbE family N-acetylglucosaminyl deacetylase
MNIVLVVSPHPDDETLGCGGTLLRHKYEGCEVHWLIMTSIDNNENFTKEKIATREREISIVAKKYNFTSVHRGDFPTTQLDTIPMTSLISFVANVFKQVMPTTIYIPYKMDVHTDHGMAFDAVSSCCKSFRYPSVKQVRIYETLSETEFTIEPNAAAFKPNLWIDISGFISEKIKIMKCYDGEMAQHPFPRSEENIRALATYRGAVAGCVAAEAFMSVKEVL